MKDLYIDCIILSCVYYVELRIGSFLIRAHESVNVYVLIVR